MSVVTPVWPPKAGRPYRQGVAARVPEATIARLAVYLRSLSELEARSVTTVSSERLAELTGVTAAVVRRDLSYLGSFGTRGVGYDVDFLLSTVRSQLGVEQERPVIVVGAGNLGAALVGFKGFRERGFPVVAVLDSDPTKVGTRIGPIVVRDPAELPAVVAEYPGCLGVVAVPGEAAQKVAGLMVDAGVRSILTFAPAVIEVPDGVNVRAVDLSVELQVLSYFQARVDGDVGLDAVDDDEPERSSA